MLNIRPIESQFKVTINPIIDCIDDDQSDVSSQHEDPLPSPLPSETIITLRDDWAIIASHRKFKLEYKEFISKNLPK